MPDVDLHAIAERYHKALEAKPSNGPMTEQGIAAITDSVADVPDLLAEVERLRERESVIITNGSLMLDAAEATIARVEELAEEWADAPEVGGNSAEQWEFDTERNCARALREALNDTDVTPTTEATAPASGEVTRFISENSGEVGKTTLRAGVRDGASGGHG